METVIKKWGNSLAVRIPKSIALPIDLEEGSNVRLKLNGNKIEISVTCNREQKLDDMLSKITDENLHREIDSGSSIGKEF